VKNVLIQHKDEEKMKVMSLLEKGGGCWIKRTANGHSAVGRHIGVKESAIRFVTEMKMSREEALRPLLLPVQKFLVEIVVNPS
jgi:hypothetical protein